MRERDELEEDKSLWANGCWAGGVLRGTRLAGVADGVGVGITGGVPLLLLLVVCQTVALPPFACCWAAAIAAANAEAIPGIRCNWPLLTGGVPWKALPGILAAAAAAATIGDTFWPAELELPTVDADVQEIPIDGQPMG